ncbi:hypothetical protein DYI23_07985 [Roseibium polysiphoniae]|uniref:Uncharacterized protein n=1 Tax=Roseibium polysiphoniae TaxID=2571221 RepID=A0A944GSC6_9HYPH|nr:hypothetical protein [Roseibium polysiphoniae]
MTVEGGDDGRGRRKALTHTVENNPSFVIVGLVPAIQIATPQSMEEWILGTRPRMTPMGMASLTSLSMPSRTSAAKIRDPVHRNLTAHADATAFTGSLPAQGKQRRQDLRPLPE